MTEFRLSQPAKSTFGSILWVVVALCVFVWLYAKSTPTGETAREMAAAGPGGVTAFFATPEEAVAKINTLLKAHNWKQLARYYDFTMSSVPPQQVLSGAYFDGALATPPEPATKHPFPPGYRFLYSEPTELDGIYRIVVVSAPLNSPDPSKAPQASFLMRAEPEGYRIVPADAAGRLKAEALNP